MESIITVVPAVVILAVALILLIVSCVLKSINKICTCISVVLVVAALTYALIMGAELTDCALVCVLFFLLILLKTAIGGRGK